MDPAEWRRIVERIHVSVPMGSAYTALTTAEGLMGWFPMEAVLTDAEGQELPPGHAATPGDGFRFAWHVGEAQEGEFLEANGVDRVRFTFGEDIEVTAYLEDAGDGSLVVTVEQTQARSDDENLRIVLGFKHGWAFYITNLKSVLEGGPDLRDFTHTTEGMINY